jgi:hypothetical protein
MSNKIRTKINYVSGADFEFYYVSKLFRPSNYNKMLLPKILGIKQAEKRIEQISNALTAQNDPQGNLIEGKAKTIIDFVNNIVFETFKNTVDGLLMSGYSRTQAVNGALEVAFRMTKSQYENVYNVIDPDRFPSKQLALEFKNTLQLGNLTRAIEFFQ